MRKFQLFEEHQVEVFCIVCEEFINALKINEHSRLCVKDTSLTPSHNPHTINDKIGKIAYQLQREVQNFASEHEEGVLLFEITKQIIRNCTLAVQNNSDISLLKNNLEELK